MAENAPVSWTWLVLAHLAVSLFTLAVLVLIFLLLKQAWDSRPAASAVFSSAAAASGGKPRPSASTLVETLKAQAQLKPGRSCGHCGTRIKTEPVRGIALNENSYLVYACPDCKKETLLPQ